LSTVKKYKKGKSGGFKYKYQLKMP